MWVPSNERADQHAQDSSVLFVEALCASKKLKPSPTLSLSRIDRLGHQPGPLCGLRGLRGLRGQKCLRLPGEQWRLVNPAQWTLPARYGLERDQGAGFAEHPGVEADFPAEQ